MQIYNIDKKGKVIYNEFNLFFSKEIIKKINLGAKNIYMFY